jgi:hypothetical protein
MAKSASRPRAARSSGARAAVLQLDAGIYSQEALERACEAFARLATIELHRVGKKLVVRFSKVEPGAAERLVDEFANYALSCLVVPS